MPLAVFTEIYLDWANNFLTVERFAEHYAISVEQAQTIIDLGRQIDNLTLEHVLY